MILLLPVQACLQYCDINKLRSLIGQRIELWEVGLYIIHTCLGWIYPMGNLHIGVLFATMEFYICVLSHIQNSTFRTYALDNLFVICQTCVLNSLIVSIFQQSAIVSTYFIDHPSEESLHGTALTKSSYHLAAKIDDTANTQIDPSTIIIFPQTFRSKNESNNVYK